MIAFQEALDNILQHAPALASQRLSLEEARGRFLAQPIQARHDLPPFDQSAMDGYGVRVEDVAGASERTPASLELAGAVRAGDPGQRGISAGQAVRLLTGAKVPRGVEAVVMQECCQQKDGRLLVQRPVKPGENIRRQGEEFAKGAAVLPAGLAITPPVIGLLASLGYAQVMVHRQPRVALVVTGSELLAPGEPLRAGKIRDANSYALAAALEELGIPPVLRLRVPDDRRQMRRDLARALRAADVIIAAGGVSVGDHDHVKGILADLGVETVHWQVAIKPGKPNYFGLCRPSRQARSSNHSGQRERLIFGLPGNPVAALLSFQQFVRPALLRLMGAQASGPFSLTARLTAAVRKKPGRLEWVRGRLGHCDGLWTVTPTVGQESHMLGGLACADCLIRFPAEQSSLAEGETVTVEVLSWK